MSKSVKVYYRLTDAGLAYQKANQLVRTARRRYLKNPGPESKEYLNTAIAERERIRKSNFGRRQKIRIQSSDYRQVSHSFTQKDINATNHILQSLVDDLTEENRLLKQGIDNKSTYRALQKMRQDLCVNAKSYIQSLKRHMSGLEATLEGTLDSIKKLTNE
jgi:hypothetical protein